MRRKGASIAIAALLLVAACVDAQYVEQASSLFAQEETPPYDEQAGSLSYADEQASSLFGQAEPSPYEKQAGSLFYDGQDEILSYDHDTTLYLADEAPGSVGRITYITRGPTPDVPVDDLKFALRFGWWAVDANGDLTKVGEYQELNSAPFANVDTLLSDGLRTLDITATGLGRESAQALLDYSGPRLQADVDLQRYPHRLDHDPLTNMGNLASGELIIREDLNAGEDYAIRVEDLKTSFHGKLSEKVKVRFNFRALHKKGARQAVAARHCFGGVPQDFGVLPLDNHCHVMTERQRIDWVTMKFEPVIETKVGPIRVEYSRPMRVFSQNDQIVEADFGVHDQIDVPYAVVPESFTQTDRLKLAADLGRETDVYARLQLGDTHNKLRETHRKFHGVDLRMTNRSIDGLTLTGFANLNGQSNQNLPFFLTEEADALGVTSSVIPPAGIRHPIDYSRTSVGANLSWLPFHTGDRFRGLRLTTGAEQGLIERHFAEYVVQEPRPVGGDAIPPGPIYDQNQTTYTSFHAGLSHRWSPCFDTFVRYKLRVTQDPLFAVNRYFGYANTSLPKRENRVDIGGTWMPATNFLATATVGLEYAEHHSDVAYFDENSYPVTFTLWYAPTPRSSLSAGFGQYSNWIDQDITFPSDTPGVSVGDTQRWGYEGFGRVLSIGGSYVWSDRLTLTSGVQFVRSRDSVDPLASWPDVPGYFDVEVDRTRVTGGVDWLLRDHISAYLRYTLEDYEDKSVTYNSGTAHMLLSGFSATF